MTAQHAGALGAILNAHLQLTGSAVAHRLLADFGRALSRFSVIMPRDYKRVLQATSQARAAGTDVDEAVMAAARG
jgi:glutamate synthase (NADPH/NADH) large chain